MGLGVPIQDGVLLYRIGCLYMRWGLSIWFWVLEYVMAVLVYGMECW